MRDMTCEKFAEVEARVEEAADRIRDAVSRKGAAARMDRGVLWDLFKLRDCLNELPQLDRGEWL